MSDQRIFVDCMRFDTAAVERAQAALDMYPDRSNYWDSPSGQDALEVIVALNLVARGRPLVHVCSCCGEECASGHDCCSDDFPEPGDIRETGR